MSFDILLGIDMETDIGSFTDQYSGVADGTDPLLKLLAGHHAQATFFWTGHAAQNHPHVVTKVNDAKHETGCHGLFHETLGDPLFHLPNNWPILTEEIPGRLAKATDILASITGKRPTSFRCPRLWGSTAVVNALEALGYLCDVTLLMQACPERLTPYHPSSDNWMQPGDMRLVQIPNFCEPPSLTPNDELDGCSWLDPWPVFRTESAGKAFEMIDRFLDHMHHKTDRPVLAFYFHPWEFCPMPQGAIDYGQASVTPLPFLTKNCGPVACEQFDLLLAGLHERGGVFRTAHDIALDWQ